MTAEEKERSDAAWATVLANMGLVDFQVHRYRRCRGVSTQDLRQDAALALYEAARRFDPGRGYALSTYGRHRIGEAIRRRVGDRGAARVPKHARDLAWRVASGRANEADLDDAGRRTVALALAAMGPGVGESTEGGVRMLRAIPGRGAAPDDDAEDVGLAVASLPERERDVIRMRFYEDMTLDEVGAACGLTKQRIGQIEKKALWRLRFRVAS